MSYNRNKQRTVFVAGRGDTANAVVHALSSLPAIQSVRQIGDFDTAKAASLLAGGDLLVEMVGGVTPAFNVAMAALSQGVACVTANPMLVAAHGRVLGNAAKGQHAYFGFQAAGFGMPVSELMAATRPSKVTVSFVSAASMALARMAYRNESLAHVSAHLKMQKIDLSDWGGKVTQARALALRALWFGDEMRGSQLARVGIEQVEAQDVKRLREFGLQPVFGAEITEEGIKTGPLAVPHGSPLLNATVQDVLVAETGYGDMILTHSGDEVQRAVAGVMADVRQFLHNPKPAQDTNVRAYGFVDVRQPVRAYVRVPYAAREQVLGFKPEILSERVDGDGLWQAVIEVPSLKELRLETVGGMVYPISGEWDEPVAGGLRMVG